MAMPIVTLPAGTEVTANEVKAGDTPSTTVAHDFGDEFSLVVEVDPGKDKKEPTPEKEEKVITVREVKEEPEKKEEVAEKEDEVVPKVKDEDLPPIARSTTTVDDKGTVVEPEIKAQYESLKKEYEARVAEIEQLKSVKLALEEIERSPQAFIARYVPDLAAKISPQDVVVQSLKKEFTAEELASYDQAQAYEEGTISYRIREREATLREQTQRQRLEGENTRLNETRKLEARLQESKQKVMKEYKLSDAQFDQEIVNWAKNHPIDFESIARLRYFDWHLQNIVDQVQNRKRGKQDKLPGSIAGVSGTDTDPSKVSAGFKEFRDEFGD
jgi:hypothetical protein